MKKILFIAFLFISNFCFSQARELAGRDTTNHRPGLIYKDTLQTWQADSPIVITKVSPYLIKLGLSSGFAGGYLTKSTLYPTKLFMGTSPNTYNYLGIGTDTAYTQLEVYHAIADNVICDTCGIMLTNPTKASASNSVYSPELRFSATGNNGSTVEKGLIRNYLGTSSTGTYQNPTLYWDIFNDGGDNWVHGLQLSALSMGGGAPTAGLTVGAGGSGGQININQTANQIDIGSNSNVFTVGSTGNFGGIKIIGKSFYLYSYSSYNDFWIPNGISFNNVSATTLTDSSALVDMYTGTATIKGLLPPRLTTNQRDSLTGAVYAVSLTSAGSGYTNGSAYQTLSGGSGTGATGYVTVSGGVVTNVQIFASAHRGVAYKVGDVLTVGGTGTGGTVTVTRVGQYAANVTNGITIYNTDMNRINWWNGTEWKYSPTIYTGTAAPATTPLAIGDEFVDTVNKKIYFATGTSTSTDWTITN